MGINEIKIENSKCNLSIKKKKGIIIVKAFGMKIKVHDIKYLRQIHSSIWKLFISALLTRSIFA